MNHRLLLIAPLLAAVWQPISAPAQQPEPAAPAPRRAGLPEGVRAVRDVEYAKVDGHSLKLDLYLPAAPANPKPDQPPAKPHPVIVWIHGGGWSAGSKAGCPAALFVPDGFAAVSISYRLTPVAPFPAQIHDCKGAIRWLRAHAAEYNLDPEHIGVWGASAGGHLAALLGTSGGDKDLEGTVGGNEDRSSAVQAVCDWFGPSDIVTLAHAEVAALKPTTGAGDTAGGQEQLTAAGGMGILDMFLGGPVRTHLDLAKQASPTTYISKNDPPFLIMHGDKDQLVPLSQSQELLAKLTEAGVEAKLHVVGGAGHGFRGRPEVQMTEDFFKARLKTDPKP